MPRKNKARQSTFYSKALHEQAKDLLRNTSLPVMDMLGVLEVGWKKFYREFNRREGMDPGEYRVKHKPYLHMNNMAHVDSLINDPHLSDRDVALKLGYKTPRAFIIAYEKETGLKPKAYREKIYSRNNEQAERRKFLARSFMVVSNPRIQDIVDYVNKTDIKTADLSGICVAKKFSYTPGGMYLAFKTATGMKYSDFVQRRRVEAAMNILADMEEDFKPDYLIKKVGLKNHPAFREVFKKITGETPSEFQRRIKPIIEAKIEQEVEKFQDLPLYRGATCKYSDVVYSDIRQDIFQRRNEILEETGLNHEDFFEKVFERIKPQNSRINHYQLEHEI